MEVTITAWTQYATKGSRWLCTVDGSREGRVPGWLLQKLMGGEKPDPNKTYEITVRTERVVDNGL